MVSIAIRFWNWASRVRPPAGAYVANSLLTISEPAARAITATPVPSEPRTKCRMGDLVGEVVVGIWAQRTETPLLTKEGMFEA
ncbi:hypothetical protein GCM10028824_05120 [Hymenobacter segetis]